MVPSGTNNMSIISKDGSGQPVHMPADAVTTEHPEGDWHALPIDEVLDKLNSESTGLTNDEVVRRRELYGRNKLDEKPPVPKWIRFLEQFNDPMVYLLITAAIIAFLFEREDIGTVSYTHLTLPTKA